ILIDAGASTNFARCQTVARNSDKYADALCESEGRGQVSVKLADGTVVNVPGVRMDLTVKFEDFDSTESFLVLDMDKYDLILGMPWLEKQEPWIDWRGKAIEIAGLQSLTELCEDVAMSLATGRETKAHCQTYGIASTASPNAESRRAVWASTVAVPDGTDQAAGNVLPQAGNIGPQAAEAAGEDAESASSVGNIGPQAGNVVPQTAEAVEEDAESASGVGNIVPRMVEATRKTESATCVSRVGNQVPRGVKKASTSADVPLSTSRVDNQVPYSGSETPPARPVKDQYHVFDAVSACQVKAGAVHLEALPEVSALLDLEELFIKDFLVELKAGEIA
ncbi:Pol protein, partial [Phytophthora palmivora]